MKTDHAEMRDLIERADNVGEAPRRQDEGIAAGDDHLPELRALANIVVGALERFSAQHPGLFADDLSAEAKATVDRAQQCRLQQNPVGVAMYHPRNRRPTP